MNKKKIFACTVVSGIVILVVSMVFSYLFQALFNYDVLNLAGMRSASDPIMALFFLHPFVIGFVLTVLFAFARKSFTGTAAQNGIALGIVSWIVSSVPSAFIVFSSMNYPIGFTANSAIGSFFYMVTAGFAIAKIAD